jgi:Rho GDP-dissociation inhibitor
MSGEQETAFNEEQELEENYKAPPQKTIEEILSLDNEDESLRKYKEALLGSQADKIIIDANNLKDVIVKRLVLVVADRPDMILELDGDLSQLKKQNFAIKEGIQYKIRIEFYVQREIVHGLKYVQKTSRMGVTVDKMTHMVGSYPPKAEIQSFTTNFEEAPSGLLARGEYSVASLFTDDDDAKHLKWDWVLKVEKDW